MQTAIHPAATKPALTGRYISVPLLLRAVHSVVRQSPTFAIFRDILTIFTLWRPDYFPYLRPLITT